MNTVCRSCKAPILWATTKNGESIPLDPDPTPDGNLILMASGVALVRAKTDQSTLPGFDDAPRYVSHFSTCPQADEWRKP